MLKLTALLCATLLVLSSASIADSSQRLSQDDITQMMGTPSNRQNLLGDGHRKAIAQACCKICRQGKACGDTCISRDKVCRVGPGCACDGWQLLS